MGPVDTPFPPLSVDTLTCRWEGALGGAEAVPCARRTHFLLRGALRGLRGLPPPPPPLGRRAASPFPFLAELLFLRPPSPALLAPSRALPRRGLFSVAPASPIVRSQERTVWLGWGTQKKASAAGDTAVATFPGQGPPARLLGTQPALLEHLLVPLVTPRCLPLAKGRRGGSHEHPLGTDGGP
ncbi:hypothetical protein P7K49_030997 [Saguinus oedipus]|uniref:Uncharacterized protein n=1 Tax=Saguinus oedipus TaxID=9490 RepID=A0ABQ9U3R6_SAGOE|nr:hypothetical protein P7K49_030997 [Saguinus oedipus]